MNTQTDFDFEDILKEARTIYGTLKPGENCPPDEALMDYVYDELAQEECKQVLEHIKNCERCHVEALKMEADREEWEFTLIKNPDTALANALGPLGLKRVLSEAGYSDHKELPVISKLKDAIITWISPVWEPMWTGQLVTASSDIPEQDHEFEMDYGEYINLSCCWKGKERDFPPHIQLSWNANIVTNSNLWARFINPETQETLSEFCLGTELEGKAVFTSDELGFDPSGKRWAISIVIQISR